MRGRESAKDMIVDCMIKHYGVSVSRSSVTQEHNQLSVRGSDLLKVQGEVQNVDVCDQAGSLKAKSQGSYHSCALRLRASAALWIAERRMGKHIMHACRSPTHDNGGMSVRTGVTAATENSATARAATRATCM